MDLKETIKELSDIYDRDSANSFVSLYLNKKNYQKFLDKRIKAIKTVLKNDEYTNFEKTIPNVLDLIKETNNENIAVFASSKYNFEKVISLPVKIDDLLVIDSSPYIRPLARVYDEWESFTLVLISSNYAKIFEVSLGEIKDTKSLSKDIMNKHKKGGCSQARFNRLRRGAIQAFLTEVTEELRKKVDNKIVVAGPGITKQKFIEMLPKNIQEKIIDVIDVDVDDENKLLKQSFSLVSKREKEQSSEAVQQLKEEILKDGLAVYGIKETLEAVRNGQVELLLIKKDFKPKGWICENCQAVDEGFQKTCPYCNGKTSEVDVLEEILEFAERTDAKIEFADDEELKDLGNVGGILRFK